MPSNVRIAITSSCGRMVRPRLGLGNARNQATERFDNIVFRRALSLKLPVFIKELKTIVMYLFLNVLLRCVEIQSGHCRQFLSKNTVRFILALNLIIKTEHLSSKFGV